MHPVADALRHDMEKRAAAVEQAVCDLDDAQLFSRVAPTTNTVGNLVLHLAGNIRTYLGAEVGGVPYERDRPFEFNATGVGRDELLARFREAVDVGLEVLGRLDESELAATIPDGEFAGTTKARLAVHVVEHLGYHAGQIVLLVKVLRSAGGSPA